MLVQRLITNIIEPQIENNEKNLDNIWEEIQTIMTNTTQTISWDTDRERERGKKGWMIPEILELAKKCKKLKRTEIITVKNKKRNKR